MSRLADTAHPVELATDGDTLSFWLSELTENATIDIELSYSRLQVLDISFKRVWQVESLIRSLFIKSKILLQEGSVCTKLNRSVIYA